MKSIIYTAPIIMLRTLCTTFVTLTTFWWDKLRGKASRHRVDDIIRAWAIKVLKIVDVQLHVEGKRPTYLLRQPYIIMSNHASLYDIPIIYAALPGSIRMIAKRELSLIPYFGASLTHSEFIFIDRNNRLKAIEDLKKAKTKMLDGIVIWAAPEGKRTRNGELSPFKKGIFKLAQDTDAVIIPVVITGARRLLPAKTWKFNAHQDIHVRIGHPIDACAYAEPILINKVRQTMIDLL